VTQAAYHEPATVEEACRLLAEHQPGAHLIAGGVALTLWVKDGVIQPEHVVSLRSIRDLERITRTADGGLEVGAMVTHRRLETSADALAYSPALSQAFGSIGSIRIRNMATIGGNLVQADPNHDPPPMLIALRAGAVLTSRRGQRVMALEDFFVDNGKTAILADEILTSVRLPPRASGQKSHYVKFLPRSAADSGTVTVAVAVDLGGDGIVRDLRLALGSVGPTVIRARKAEDVARGQRLTPHANQDIAAAARAESRPASDIRGSADYKKDMVAFFVAQSLSDLALDAASA